MIKSVLVVCVGNICRSPVGERLLAKACPDIRVESAGIAALEGHGPDPVATEVALAAGVSVEGHIARQFTAELARGFDLILALEKGHIRVIEKEAPAVSGKAMLLGHWIEQGDIADPYRKSRDFHEVVFSQLSEATAAWSRKLGAA
ncbi:MAG: low molecular weight phosphotyrosine protein phosphatase [Rhodobacteraceae bacterium]|nr:low molecular weight phosphotyrosine protein phosphatase [Paracoccaceae bacterium]